MSDQITITIDREVAEREVADGYSYIGWRRVLADACRDALSQTPEAEASTEDQPEAEGPYEEGQLFQALGVDMFLEGQEAAIANAAYAAGKAAANPSPIPEDGGWQPIETAPKDGTDFLAVCPRPGYVVAQVHWNPTTKAFLTSEGGIRDFECVAWMPLPAPPTEGSES